MDTLRVDVRYRPLRVAWAIRAGDVAGFRRAIRTSCTLWGGLFNPVVFIDREREAKQLVDLFRVDFIAEPDGSPPAPNVAASFPHLKTPFFPEHIFVGGAAGPRAHLLDLENALVHIHERSEWPRLAEPGVRLYSWEADDPLADALLVLFGGYPEPAVLGRDYRSLLAGLERVEEFALARGAIPADTLEHLPAAYFSRVGLARDRALGLSSAPGFFVGDSSNLEDLVTFWNLRAAGVPVFFVDPSHRDRFAELSPAWERRTRSLVAHRREALRRVAVWAPLDKMEQALRLFDGPDFVGYPVSSASWNGLNVRPSGVFFGRTSTLGVVGTDRAPPRVAFQLNDKPFSSDPSFYSQHLVASLSVSGSRRDDQYTFQLPYVPELNEFFARAVEVPYNALRIESERIGLVVTATESDTALTALRVTDVVEQLFKVAGLAANISSGGLILRQLLSQLDGPQGARAFKIPGVRRLIRTHGPTGSFSKRSALQLIAARDPARRGACFSDHEGLFIEPRPLATSLTPDAVFSYLVGKGLFRIGVTLVCPRCRMSSWTPLDVLKHLTACDLCGHHYDASRQLVDAEWQFRRSGILGAQKDAQGAIPVALTLQQLDTTLGGGLRRGFYSPSLDVILSPDPARTCEVDLVWVIPRPATERTAVILGEIKDAGGTIDSTDCAHLAEIADAFPGHRFATFVLLAKLAPFTAAELALVSTLNRPDEPRTILLTDRELEPYGVFDRTDHADRQSTGTPEDLARATTQLYLGDRQ